MLGHIWLAYFQANARLDCPPAPGLYAEVPAALRAALVISLGRFQLGESAGGRIHEEMNDHSSAALGQETRRSIQLYIEEEWRHARELAMVITALGGELQRAHWTNAAFTACRRILGLRTKMLTLAVAEVVGIVYYRALARGVGSPALAASLERIADEESKHLDFQAAFFEHALSTCSPVWRAPYRWLLQAQLLAIFVAALMVLLLDHGRVLRAAGAGAREIASEAWKQLRGRRFLSSERPRLAASVSAA